ncbi:hypothetical protein Trydic_g5626 [Trypoxylus dichotomus]
MLPYAEDHLSVLWKYQQDNDPKHTAKIAKDWFRQNHVDLLDWPSCSPDLNPIENLWQDVELRTRDKNISNLEELFRCVEEVWNNIPISISLIPCLGDVPQSLKQVLIVVSKFQCTYFNARI